ncbi:hypothetical protein TIFTF001_044773 [Ficus carica]|uniref:Uncharacterized protein n=1 Tax=Ficus carica TaxID=3494 RepID=A0AA87ZWG4_FICCA|nr:hypothetical protein TIFTF001_044773 [Ficus carica]
MAQPGVFLVIFFTTLFLVLLSVSLLLQHGMMEQKRCRQLLYTRGCDRLGRGEQCWAKHRDWFECI